MGFDEKAVNLISWEVRSCDGPGNADVFSDSSFTNVEITEYVLLFTSVSLLYASQSNGFFKRLEFLFKNTDAGLSLERNWFGRQLD
jgi:hypothetical protein